MRDGGKGDKPRPIPNWDKFEKNWDSIFKKKEQEYWGACPFCDKKWYEEDFKNNTLGCDGIKCK